MRELMDWKLIFFNADILNWRNSNGEIYDVIVSNPPYIRESEKKQMQSNVLNLRT